MPRCPLKVLSALAGLVAMPGVLPLSAQPASQPVLEKVNQGFGDTGPLNQDLRIQPMDLRVPVGFDSVYRGYTTDAYGETSEFFARRSGAVTAVFPRSVYSNIGNGVHLAEIPPGTVYYIGDLPPEITGATATAPAVAQRAPTPMASESQGLSAVPFDASIERLSALRRGQIATELIRRAARAEKSRLIP